MYDPFSEPPRFLRLSVGVLVAFVAVATVLGTCTSLALWGLGIVPLPSLPKLALGSLIQGLWNGFWIRTAYRLLYNRTNREGGLFSSFALYAVSTFCALAALALLFAPPGDSQHDSLAQRIKGIGLCWTLGLPSLYLARSRRASRTS